MVRQHDAREAAQSGTKEKKPETKPEGGAALPWLFPAGNF